MRRGVSKYTYLDDQMIVVSGRFMGYVEGYCDLGERQRRRRRRVPRIAWAGGRVIGQACETETFQ